MDKMHQSEYEDRVNKLKKLKELKIPPYPSKSTPKIDLNLVLSRFDKSLKSKKIIVICGRVRSKRSHGNLIFFSLQDHTGFIQVAISKKEINAEKFSIFKKYIEVGDFIEIKGECFITHKGEKSVFVKEYDLLSKAIRPLPEKWHGLKDEEEIYRKRYLDILYNKETKELFLKKEKFWSSIRSFLKSEKFVEVETPVLEVKTGGADAKPFITYHNSFGINVYLRISMGELWQKKLMIAGFEKTFEIGRQFRNEGMDAEHLQDYTQVEFYWAYANYIDGMNLVEKMFKHIAEKTFETLIFEIKGKEINLGSKWEIYDYQKIVKKFTGIDILNTTVGAIEKKLKDLNIEYDVKGFNITRGVDNLWKYCRKNITGPGFLVGVPVAVSPLAKRDEKNPMITQRFQPIIAGTELGNGYTELNDPLDQRERFIEQNKLREQGDEEAQMYNEEFIEALEYGMPPTCGFGMSERVFAFLNDKSLRECQLFPLMKPKKSVISSDQKNNAVIIINQEIVLESKEVLDIVAILSFAYGAKAGNHIINENKSSPKFPIAVKTVKSGEQITELKVNSNNSKLVVIEYANNMSNAFSAPLGILISGDKEKLEYLTKNLDFYK